MLDFCTAPLGVVGLGLIGGSIARSAAAAGQRIVAVDTTPLTAESGIELVGSVQELCVQAPGLVVVATPLQAMPTIFAELDTYLPPESTVVDVASVKGPLLQELGTRLHRCRTQYVSVHPMAGTELAGFEHSSATMLDAAPWAVIPPLWGTDPARMLAVVSWLTCRFQARVHPLNAAEHDTAVALISQFPHVLANTLLAMAGASDLNRVAFGLAAGSFRDGTRVAGISTARTEAMVRDNAHALIPLVEAAADSLRDTAAQLRQGQPGRIFADAEVAFQAKQAQKLTTAKHLRISPDPAGIQSLLAVGAAGGWVTAAKPVGDAWEVEVQCSPSSGAMAR